MFYFVYESQKIAHNYLYNLCPIVMGLNQNVAFYKAESTAYIENCKLNVSDMRLISVDHVTHLRDNETDQLALTIHV